MDWQGLAVQIEQDNGHDPLYAKIVRHFRRLIEAGELPAETKLPTNRELAALLRFDRSTISRAYLELSKEGLIDSHVGRGTFVRSPAREAVRPVEGSGSSWHEKFSRASHITLEMTAKQPNASSAPNTISFSGGIPTEEFYPQQDLEQIVQELLSSGQSHEMFEYSPAEGQRALRREVLKHLHEQGIEATDEELLIVSGSQQAIDLVTTVFVDPGDNVVIEDPSYFWAICNFRSRQARCLTVPVDEHGMQTDLLARTLHTNSAKLIYTMPSFQNPTGATMLIERREKLLSLARQYQTPILEDNFVGDLYYDGRRTQSLRSLPGGKESVIHQGTFSKALCPGLRLGWIVAPPEVANRLLLAKRVSDLSTNSMAQITLAKFLSNGLYAHHLERVKESYRKRRDTMLGALGRWFPRKGSEWDLVWQRPAGGLFVWVKLPDRLSSRDFLPFAEGEGVSFSPGELFFLTADRKQYMRLCFIQTDEKSIEEGIRRMSIAYQRYLQTIIGTARSSFVARDANHILI